MIERAGQRGVTLIELMIVLAISSIVATVFATTMVAQQRAFLHQIDNTEAQQNARAALDILCHHIRRAGFGYHPTVAMQGDIPVGACHADVDPRRQSTDCDNVDANTEVSGVHGTGEVDEHTGGSDRIRLSYALADAFVATGTTQASAGSFNTEPGTGPAMSATDSRVGLLSGPVDAAGNFASDLVLVRRTGTADAYTYTLLDPGATRTWSLYDVGFNFGAAEVADFYIDRTIAATPRLMLRIDSDDEDTGHTHVVARDIDDLQVQYGIETGDPTHSGDVDLAVDVWCNDPRLPSDGGDCATLLPTSRENFARIVAVRVALVTRTRSYKQHRATGLQQMTVQNHTIKGRGDGFTRWVYRATVALRNNDIRPTS